jgi:ABC-type amino acid transport substrate-binding protein
MNMSSTVISTPIATLEPGVLTICAYVEFAPFTFEVDGEIAGTDIALLKAFAISEVLSIRILKQAFMNLWQRPGLDECDVAAAGIAALPTRDLTPGGVWSIPYMTVRRSLLIRAGDVNRLRSPSDFRSKKIVVTPHSTADFDTRERYEPLGAEVIGAVPSQREVVRALLRGDIDAFAEGDVSNAYLARQYIGPGGQAPLALADIHSMETVETLHFAVRAADPCLVARLNAYIPGQNRNAS